MTLETLFTWPRSVSTSQALVSAKAREVLRLELTAGVQQSTGKAQGRTRRACTETSCHGRSPGKALCTDPEHIQHPGAPFMRHSLTWRSSAPETMRGREGWKEAQLTPLSCPSNTYLTTASPPPNRSVFICTARG